MELMNLHRNLFNTTPWESTVWIFAQRQWGKDEPLYHCWFLKVNIVSDTAVSSVDLLKHGTCWDSSFVRLFTQLQLINYCGLGTVCINYYWRATLIHSLLQCQSVGVRGPFHFSVSSCYDHREDSSSLPSILLFALFLIFPEGWLAR